MNKKLTFVVAMIDKWKPKMELNHWDIHIYLIDEDKYEKHGPVAAECRPNVAYSHAAIDIFPEFFNRPKKEQEEIIIHELCHCLTQEYKDLFDRGVFKEKIVTTDEESMVNERLTSWISRLINRLTSCG